MCNLTTLVRCTNEEMDQVIKSTEQVIKERIAKGKKTTLEVVEIIMKQNLTQLRRINQ